MDIYRDDLDACVDCTVFLANGDLPEERDDLPAEIDRRWAGFELVVSCDDECEGRFSWRPCDICGSSLGGDRHTVTALVSAT